MTNDKDFCCAKTGKLLIHPVKVHDRIYEREAIEDCLVQTGTDPNTGKEISPSDIQCISSEFSNLLNKHIELNLSTLFPVDDMLEKIQRGDIDQVKRYPLQALKQTSAEGKTCLYVAIESNQSDIVDFLFKNNVIFENLVLNKENYLRMCIESNNVDIVRVFSKYGALSSIDRHSFFYALKNCSNEIVQLILEYNSCLINAKDDNGNTPLHIVVQMDENDSPNMEDMIQLLVDYGANPFSIWNKNCESVVDYCKTQQKPNVLSTLSNCLEKKNDRKRKQEVMKILPIVTQDIFSCLSSESAREKLIKEYHQHYDDEELEYLSQYLGYRHFFSLKYSQSMNIGLDFLVGTPIRYLDLSSKFDSKIIQRIGNSAHIQQHLQRLALIESTISDEELKIISGLTNLTHLNLSHTQVSGTGHKYISKLKNLAELNLTFSGTRDNDLMDISTLKNLAGLNISYTSITDVGVKYIVKLTALTQLNISFTNICDESLKHISNLTALTQLNLSHTGISGQGLSYIEGLKNLSHLNIDGNSIPESVLAHIAELPNITQLNIKSIRINHGIEDMSTLRNLSKLELHYPNLNDKSFELISRLSNLTELKINGVDRYEASALNIISRLTNLTYLQLPCQHIGDDELGHISKLTNLTHLDLRCSQNHNSFTISGISQEGGVHISKLTNLTHLTLIGATIAEQRLDFISQLTKLTQLNLESSNVGDEGAIQISKMTNLTELNISNTKISDYGLKHLSNLKYLTRLDMNSTNSDCGVEYISKLTNLTTLTLSWAKVGYDAPQHLYKLTNLTHLDISGSNITDDGLKHISKLTHLTHLHVQSRMRFGLFNNKPIISDKGVAHISNLLNLTDLNLSCTRVSNMGLEQVSKLTHLTQLSLSHTRITNKGLKHISKLTHLTELNLSHTRITEVGLKHISNLKELSQLNLSGIKYTYKEPEHIFKLKSLTEVIVCNSDFANRIKSEFTRYIHVVLKKQPGSWA